MLHISVCHSAIQLCNEIQLFICCHYHSPELVPVCWHCAQQLLDTAELSLQLSLLFHFLYNFQMKQLLRGHGPLHIRAHKETQPPYMRSVLRAGCHVLSDSVWLLSLLERDLVLQTQPVHCMQLSGLHQKPELEQSIF